MRLRPLACLVTATTFAADAPKLPAIPEQSIAQKKELFFADDFEKADLGGEWKIVVPRLPNPRGIESSSPGLPASGYPGIVFTNRHQP